MKKAHSGINLVEILLALSLFSLTSVGLYLSMQNMFDTVQYSLKRDVEAGYAKMLAAEVDPHNPQVETAYDVTTKTALALPDGGTLYYTRTVGSDDPSNDVKNVNVYFYRSDAGSAQPYRKFKRELAPYFFGYNAGEETEYYRDVQGRLWSPLSLTAGVGDVSVWTAGEKKSGWATARALTTYSTGNAISGTEEDLLFQTGVESNNAQNQVYMYFIADTNRTYKVSIGASEASGAIGAGDREMNVFLSQTTQDCTLTNVDTFDAFAETGGQDRAIVKTYNLKPCTHPNGTGLIVVLLARAGLATASPRISFVSVERSDI